MGQSLELADGLVTLNQNGSTLSAQFMGCYSGTIDAANDVDVDTSLASSRQHDIVLRVNIGRQIPNLIEAKARTETYKMLHGGSLDGFDFCSIGKSTLSQDVTLVMKVAAAPGSNKIVPSVSATIDDLSNNLDLIQIEKLNEQINKRIAEAGLTSIDLYKTIEGVERDTAGNLKISDPDAASDLMKIIALVGAAGVDVDTSDYDGDGKATANDIMRVHGPS